MKRVLLPILLFPLLEIYLLVRLAHWSSALDVIAYLTLAALAGGRMIARPGTLAAISGRYRFGTGSPLSDRMLEIGSGLLLILPGVLSDLLAIALLVPPLRIRLLRWAARSLPMRASAFRRQSAPRSGEPIDVASRQVE